MAYVKAIEARSAFVSSDYEPSRTQYNNLLNAEADKTDSEADTDHASDIQNHDEQNISPHRDSGRLGASETPSERQSQPKGDTSTEPPVGSETNLRQSSIDHGQESVTPEKGPHSADKE